MFRIFFYFWVLTVLRIRTTFARIRTRLKGPDPDNWSDPEPTKKVRIWPDLDPQHCFWWQYSVNLSGGSVVFRPGSGKLIRIHWECVGDIMQCIISVIRLKLYLVSLFIWILRYIIKFHSGICCYTYTITVVNWAEVEWELTSKSYLCLRS